MKVLVEGIKKMSKMAILVIGNLVTGYKFYGPFANADLAAEYANLFNLKNCFVVELDNPEVVANKQF